MKKLFVMIITIGFLVTGYIIGCKAIDQAMAPGPDWEGRFMEQQWANTVRSW